MSNITNITNKSTENIFEDSISPLKNQKNNHKMKIINISQNYLQQGFQSAKLNHNKFNDSSAFQNSTNASSIPLSNKQNQRSQASLTSTNFLQQYKQESENHRISQIKEKLNQINIPQFLIPQLHGIQSSNSQLPKSSASLQSNIKSNFNSIRIPQGTNQMSQLQQQIEGLNLQQKEQQLEMLLLTNKKLNNIERLQLKKQIQEIQDLQTYSVTHHYTCENLIETLLGTIKDLSNFKNPKIVIKSIERNFGHLQQPLDFLQFDQVTNVKEIKKQIYLKRLALACCKVEGEEIQFKANKKLLNGLLEITTKLEEKLLIYQKDHFSEIKNQLLSKNSQIRKTEQELQEKYIQLDRKAQYKELRETIDSKYNLNMRHMESKFLNSYKKNKNKLGNFSNLCKRSINIFKHIDGAIKGIDIYGVPVGVNFNNNQIHRTSFGALISACIFIVIVIQCYYSGLDLKSKTNPQVITSEQYVSTPERMVFDKVQQVIMMGFSTISSQYIYDPSIIQASATTATVKKVFNETTQQYDTVTQKTSLKIRPCTTNDVKVEKLQSFFSKLPLSNLFCFDDNQQVIVEGDYSGDSYSRVDVSFNQCVNSTKVGSVVCKPQKAIDKVLSNINFLVYMMDKILDPSNYETPFDYQGINLQVQATNQQSQNYIAYFENYYIESDVGLISKDIQRLRDFIFAGTDTTVLYNNPSLVMQFSMKPYKNKQILMQRSYMKLTDLLAQIGGVLKFLTVFGFIMCHPYAKLNLTQDLINSVFDCEENRQDSSQQKYVNSEQKNQKMKDQDSCQLESFLMKKLSLKYPQNHQYQNQIELNTDNSPKSKHESLKSQRSKRIAQQQNTKFNLRTSQNINFCQQNQSNQFNQKGSCIPDQNQQNLPLEQPCPRTPQLKQPIVNNLNQQEPLQCKEAANNDEKKKQNDINNESKDDLFKNRIVRRIQKLINPLKQKVQLTMKGYISHYSNCSQNNKNLIQEGINKIQHRLDIQNILHQLQEIEKLKKIVLDEDQIKLFEILPRPVLKNSQNKTQSDAKNQFYDSKNQSQEEQVNDAYNSLCKILNKQKKSQRDLKLIQLLDNELYLSLLKLGFLSHTKDNLLESKYDNNDEILENSSAILQSSTLKKYTQYDNLKSDNSEDINFYSNKLEVSDEGAKSDFYSNFYKKYNKNSLNLS
ncbi:hypothetical protein ABPG74_006919 [Tetrahymena malaccensis]